MVEGSLWVYGRTDLADYYRGALTLRQVYVRICSLPPESPLEGLLREQQERAAERARVAEIEATLAKFKP